jgi:hypothetical protein
MLGGPRIYPASRPGGIVRESEGRPEGRHGCLEVRGTWVFPWRSLLGGLDLKEERKGKNSQREHSERSSAS